MRGGATFDPSGAYRYHLWREWDPALPSVTFVMLNPSTADAEQADPTTRRCIGFAQAWGYGRLEVVNLFAYRATSPADLFKACEPVGAQNGDWLVQATRGQAVVAAWGNGATRLGNALPEQPGTTLSCLGTTSLGQPRHPLYVPAGQRLVPWTPAT
jgi:hypothetical protein